MNRRQLSTIEQRIVWTRFRRQTDKDVLLAMARWFCWRGDGTVREFTVDELARKAGVPKRSTERALERLEAEWLLDVITRRHRRPTTFRINLARLATEDPDALTARVADKIHSDRHSGGQDPEWRTRNGPDSEKVADQRSEEEVRTERSTRTPAPDRTEVRQSGGQQRPEHPDVPAFLEWARVTYPDHTNGAHLVLDRERDGHLAHGLLEHYPLERLQEMTVQCWTLEADDDPNSHASWIARSDRSLRVLRHKAAFLERVVVGAQQLSFGPMVKLSAQEIAEAKHLRTNVYNGCPHDPRCPPGSYADCVRAIALARHVS
jgi:hypothetical protein